MQNTTYGYTYAPSAAPVARPLPTQDDDAELDLYRLTLNQVDYGLVVVEVDKGTLQFANTPGHEALAADRPSHPGAPHDNGLSLHNGRVVTRRPADSEALERALQRTRAGLRGLLCLGIGPQSSPVAVVPLARPQSAQESLLRRNPLSAKLAPSHALLVFAKQHLCDDSTIALFARERGLTSAEGQVLAHVCRGMRPSQIATQHGVQISTVRTQLRSIRMKTGCDTIRELVHKVSVLPPMALHLSNPHSSSAGR